MAGHKSAGAPLVNSFLPQLARHPANPSHKPTYKMTYTILHPESSPNSAIYSSAEELMGRGHPFNSSPAKRAPRHPASHSQTFSAGQQLNLSYSEGPSSKNLKKRPSFFGSFFSSSSTKAGRKVAEGKAIRERTSMGDFLGVSKRKNKYGVDIENHKPHGDADHHALIPGSLCGNSFESPHLGEIPALTGGPPNANDPFRTPPGSPTSRSRRARCGTKSVSGHKVLRGGDGVVDASMRSPSRHNARLASQKKSMQILGVEAAGAVAAAHSSRFRAA
ncbi:hypothetical protein HGRIS_012648 [Hohenbuehelia grisea]|uniref:Uncharacterized protein n=1 Tax=Hohenbuehelia grisea TaxID=104357 RepID=A0ABR3IT71_9AGAR